MYWLWKPVTPGLLIFFYDLSKLYVENLCIFIELRTQHVSSGNSVISQ